jgi:hypothetical protein
MMKKQPTATQQKLIDNGAATRTLTIRYETSSYGSAARRETVKATLPDLGSHSPQELRNLPVNVVNIKRH